MMIKQGSVITPVSLTISLSVVLIAILISLSPVGKAVDRFYLDSLFAFRGAIEMPDDIVIVAIDEDSFAEIDQQWPWSRSLHARLLDSIYGAGAKAVAMDIIFSETSDHQQDSEFAEAINKFPETILAMDINIVEMQDYAREVLVKPANSLRVADGQLGFINVPTQSDGYVRELKLRASGFEALSYLAASRMNVDCCESVMDGDSILLNYTGPPGTISTVSYYQALEPERYLPTDVFKDKLVFVGFSTQTVADPTVNMVDHFPVPFTTAEAGYMSGVEIHANSASNLLNDNFLRRFSTFQYYLIAVVIAISVTILALYLSQVVGFILVAIVSSAFMSTSIYMFNKELVFLPVATMMLPLLLGYLVSPSLQLYRSNKEKRFIRNAFGSFVSPEVVDELIENPEKLSLGGKNVEASVLFLDIADFTTMSEKFEPPVLIDIINNCLNEITKIVLKHDGMIDKFIGDAVMAVWGAPAERDDHAYRACLAAIEIQQRLVQLAAEEKQRTGADLAARIGINSGSVIAGNIGGDRRFEYTVHGDDVNVASRLEGVNKFYGTKIILGENTINLLDGQFNLRELDRVRLKGKHEPVTFFELQSISCVEDTNQATCNEYYEKGLANYVRGSWQEAMKNFETGLLYIHDDGPCSLMMKRCKQFKVKSPSVGWQGVYDMTMK